jgi:quinol-cytochrome oxidoreductase complex cytochrome b subunit
MPNYLGHTDNYIQANPLVTPLHIVPEWYFSPFYAISRSIPNKAYGVIFLIFAILSLVILPFITNSLFRLSQYKIIYEFKIILFWNFLMICFILGWIGSQPIEYPFLEIGQIFTFLYFLYFIIISDISENILQYFFIKYIIIQNFVSFQFNNKEEILFFTKN